MSSCPTEGAGAGIAGEIPRLPSLGIEPGCEGPCTPVTAGRFGTELPGEGWVEEGKGAPAVVNEGSEISPPAVST